MTPLSRPNGKPALFETVCLHTDCLEHKTALCGSSRYIAVHHIIRMRHTHERGMPCSLRTFSPAVTGSALQVSLSRRAEAMKVGGADLEPAVVGQVGLHEVVLESLGGTLGEHADEAVSVAVPQW